MFKKVLSFIITVLMIFSCITTSALPVFAEELSNSPEKLTVISDGSDTMEVEVGSTFTYTFCLNVYDATAGKIWHSEDSQGYIANIDAETDFDSEYLDLLFDPQSSVNAYWPVLSEAGIMYNISDEDSTVYFNATTNGFDYLFDQNDCILIQCTFTAVKSGTTNINTRIKEMFAQDDNISPLITDYIDNVTGIERNSSTDQTKKVTVTVSPDPLDIFRGLSCTLDYSAKDDELGSYDISWSSSDSRIASVSDGVVTAKKAGTAYIEAYVNEISKAVCTVNVTDDITKAGISLSDDSFTYDGEEKTPYVTVSYNNMPLKKGKQYSLSYHNNKNAGQAFVRASSLYDDKYIDKSFVIDPFDIADCDFNYDSEIIYGTSLQDINLKVKHNGTTLTENTDYTVEYGTDTQSGPASVTINGKNNYKGSITLNITISAKDISLCSFEEISDITYTGSEITPDVKVTDGSKLLVKDTDYTLSYTKNINAGTANITVSGKGNYSSSRTLEFKILSKNIGFCTFDTVGDITYTGSALTPEVRITDGDRVLIKDTDYTLYYDKNTDKGTAQITAYGKGNYSSSKTLFFNILSKNIDLCDFEEIDDITYTGSALTPDIKITDGNKVLIEDTDYSVSYENNINAGTAKVIIAGKGNYSSSETLTFKILSKNINTCTFDEIDNMTYTGSALTPDVKITDGDKILIKDTDYTVSYENNINTGTAKVTVTGKGNYSSSETLTFKILPRNINLCTFNDIDDTTYTVSALTPDVKITDGDKVLVKDTDYTVSYVNNIYAGTAEIIINGKGNYSSTKTITFKILPRNINLCTFNDIDDMTYTGSALTPDVKITDGNRLLVKDTDYTLSYENNINAGTAEVTVSGKGNYSQNKNLTFNIIPKDINLCDFSDVEDAACTGEKITPEIKVTDENKVLIENSDYTVTYGENTDPGEGTIIIKGINNYGSQKTVTFNIIKKTSSINDCEITVSVLKYPNIEMMTENSLRPEVTVTKDGNVLTENTDYICDFENTDRSGTGQVTVKGINDYSDETVKQFKVVLRGDSDGSGGVAIIDATMIQQALARIIEKDALDLDAAILTYDDINIVDVTKIQQYLAKVINEL